MKLICLIVLFFFNLSTSGYVHVKAQVFLSLFGFIRLFSVVVFYTQTGEIVKKDESLEIIGAKPKAVSPISLL